MSHALSQLRKFVSPEIIFGAGCRHNVGNYASNFGARKVLVVSDPGVVAAGWVADVEASLQAQNLEYCLYTAVSPTRGLRKSCSARKSTAPTTAT